MKRNAQIAFAIVTVWSLACTPGIAQTFNPTATPQAQTASAQEQAGELLRRARTAMKGGNLELAERFIAQAEKLNTKQDGFLSRFADTPAKARRELDRLKKAGPAAGTTRIKDLLGGKKQADKRQPSRLPVDAVNNVGQLPATGAYPTTGEAAGNATGPVTMGLTDAGTVGPAAAGPATAVAGQGNLKEVQARSIMAQAKAAFDRGDLTTAANMTQHANAMGVSEKAYAGGDTPWELGLKIDRQMKLAGTNAGQANRFNATQANANSVSPAVYDAANDKTFVQPAAAEFPVQPPADAIAQQLQGLNPLTRQPNPVAAPTNPSGIIPGNSIPGTVPGTTPAAPNAIPSAQTFIPQELTGGAIPQDSLVPSTTSPAPAIPTADPQTYQPAPYQQQEIYQSPPTSVTVSPESSTPGSASSFPANTNGAPIEYSGRVAGQELIRMGEQAIRDNDLDQARDYFREAWAMKDTLDPGTRQRLQDHLQLLRPSREDGDSEDEDVDQEEIARVRRIISDVQREQAAIARDLRVSPKDAWERMKELRESVLDADLPAEARRPLVARLDEAVKETEAFIDANRSEIELDEQNRAVLAAVDRERRMRVEIENKLATMVDEFNDMMDQERFSEAYVLAKQAREMAPHNEVTESMIWKSRFAERMFVEMSLRDRGQRMFEFGLDPSNLETPDAYDYPIAFPKKWKELVGGREGMMTRDQSRFTETEQAIQRALRKKVSVSFNEEPLSDVIETLGRMAEINVFLDTEGLAAEGVTSNTPVTMNLSQEISLRSVLNLILGQHRLGYVIQDEVLRITSDQDVAGDVYREVYYVGDLVIPIPNFTPGYNNGMAGALAQAHAALGYGPGGFAHNRNRDKLPLAIAENTTQDANAASPLALGQLSSANPLPAMQNGPQPMGGMGGASGADFDTLINLITNTVSPNSWDDVGGPGAIESFEGNLSLVISNTQEVHEEIVDLLEQLRRLQDLQVTIEVRFVTLQDNFFERIGVDFDFDVNDNSGFQQGDLDGTLANSTFQEDGSDITIGLDPNGNPTLDLDLSFNQNSFASAVPQFGGFDPGAASTFGFAILSDIEAFFLVEAIQGDQRTNVMQAPKITMFNGQFATINDTSNRPFVTSVVPVVGDFAVAQQPVILVLAEGTQLSVQAVVSSDRRFVRLTMMPMFSQIGDVDTFTFEGRTSSDTGTSSETDPDTGAVTNTGNNNTFTEGTTVQLPNFATTSVNTVVSVPDGGTVLMGGIKRLAEGRNERGMPILSKLPYISRLFKNVGIGRETSTLMMMVTPRIIIQEEEEERVLGSLNP